MNDTHPNSNLQSIRTNIQTVEAVDNSLSEVVLRVPLLDISSGGDVSASLAGKVYELENALRHLADRLEEMDELIRSQKTPVPDRQLIDFLST